MSAVCQRSIRFRSIGRLVCLFIIAVAAASAALYTGRIASVAAASDAVAWVTLGNGAAYTWLPYVTTNHQPLGDIFVVRIVPHAVLFRIYYRPGNRKTVADWAVEMPGAAIIANASFFNGARQPMGLVKIGGAILSPAIGTAEHGLFSVVDDVPQVIPAVTIPAPKSARSYSESFESYPVLVSAGRVAPFKDNASERGRRSIIAEDTGGNILIVFTSSVELSLTEIATWLQNSGLSIETALNLDGGASAQLHLSAPGSLPALVQGTDAVPVVLAVYFR